MDSSEIYRLVQQRYGKYAMSCDNELNLERNTQIAKAFGYSVEELTSIPEGANLGVSCGNPLVTAKLEEGEVVIDLGSGAGFDVFLAALKVGPKGKAIGVDMNKDMLELARKNATKTHAHNVSFIEASITSIPLPSATANCIISNCVINLVPETDKQLVFHEMFRLLKPGGRASISDILAKMPLPEEIRLDMALYVGCIAGACQVGEYESYLKEAGFEDVLIMDKQSDLNVYKRETLPNGSEELDSYNNICCSPARCGTEMSTSKKSEPDGKGCSSSGCTAGFPEEQSPAALRTGYDLNEWVGSFQIYAVKPGGK